VEDRNKSRLENKRTKKKIASSQIVLRNEQIKLFGQDILMVGNIFLLFFEGLETRLGECLLRFVPMLALFRSLYTLVKNTHINHSLIIGSGTLALGTARYLSFFLSGLLIYFFLFTFRSLKRLEKQGRLT